MLLRYSGFGDVSWNNPEVKTPVLQNLADQGVILDQFYAQPLCTPWVLWSKSDVNWYQTLQKRAFVWSSQWHHNERDGVSNHRRLKGLLNRLFRPRSKKISKLRVTGFVKGIHRWPANSPHKGPVTRKMFPFDDVIMMQNNECCT